MTGDLVAPLFKDLALPVRRAGGGPASALKMTFAGYQTAARAVRWAPEMEDTAKTLRAADLPADMAETANLTAADVIAALGSALRRDRAAYLPSARTGRRAA